VVVRTPGLLTPTTTELVRPLSGGEVDLPKATPRFPEWKGDFPWSNYGGKPILDLHGEPLYAEIVIPRLLEAEGWSGVWVNHVHRGPFPTRWTPSPIRIFPHGSGTVDLACLSSVSALVLLVATKDGARRRQNTASGPSGRWRV
jgi:hypothetical protein